MAPRLTDTDGVLVDELVALTRQSGMRMRRRLTETGLPMGPSVCMLTLSKIGEMPTNRLASEMGIRGPTLTALLDTLEGEALILRKSDPGDRRVTLVSLTPKGNRLFEQLQRDLVDEWVRIFGPVPQAKKRAWAKVVREIREHAQAATETETPPLRRAARRA
jgi:DNA-binding MarR family transcriptional regulator